MTDRVLVTGLSGFIGSHVAKRLLEKGYEVRGTVRNRAKGEAVAAKIIEAAGGGDIEIVEANLAYDDGWAEAVKDCRYIQHIASPFPSDPPDHREGLVPEAKAGALRVLEAGLQAGAERIVMTSSIAAMIGRPKQGERILITENDWSDPHWKPLRAYAVSKTRAELAAWDHVRERGSEDRLTVVNPAFVLGPDMFANGGVSVGIIRSMMNGSLSRVPHIAYPIIDVRDCAGIHVAAMTSNGAAGRRLIAGGGTLWFKDIVNSLKAEFPDNDRLPKGTVPSFMVKMSAFFDDRTKAIIPDLEIYHEADTAYVNSLTQIIPRPAKEAVISAAKSLGF